MPRSGRRAAAVLMLALLAAAPALAGVVQVRLRLPLKAKLPLRGNERIALAPFILVTDAEKARDKRLQNVDLQAEFHRFLKKQLEKKTKFEVVETPPEIKLPTQSLTELSRAQGVLGLRRRPDRPPRSSFPAASNSGSRTAPATRPRSTPPPSTAGPTTGRSTSSRPDFSSTSCFLVLDGRTGETLLQDQFKDFRQTGSRKADELQGLFENLFSLENQILNTFVARDREAERYIFTD